MKNKNLIFFYLYLGLAFLLWENLVGSILGIHGLGLRRIIWGVVYYCLLFLMFGIMAEGINFLYSRLSPKHCWYGQKYVWLLTIMVAFLWGDISRQFIVALLDIDSQRLSYELNLIWVPFILTVGWVGNVLLARLDGAGKLTNVSKMLVYLFAAFLYLIISTKVTYRYFGHSMFTALNVILQPLFVLGTVALAVIMVRLFNAGRSLRWALIGIPLLLIFLVEGLSASFFSANGISSKPPQSTSEHPNVIVLLFDTLRADHVGAVSKDYSLTPTIDSLASQGKVYRRCYSTSSWTFPSVVSLLTSRLPNKLGLVELGYLPEDVPTVAGILRESGYYTAGISANDLISPPYGFDRSFNEFHFLRGKGSKQLLLPFHTFIPGHRFLEELAYQFDFISMDFVHADWKQMTREAQDCLEKASTKPFFLYAHFIEPHSPYWFVPFEDGILDLEQVKFSYYFPGYRAGKSSAVDYINKNKTIIMEVQHARYMDGARTADRAVAHMLQVIKRLGLQQNTIIVITSDHGEEFLEHGGQGHKSTLYEELVNIPLIIYIPPELHRQLPDQPDGVSTLDIAPTILDLAGIDSKIEDSDGWNLTQPYPYPDRPKHMMVEVKKNFWSAVVLGPYKLILIDQLENGKVDTLLFNLGVDKAEKINLYPREKRIADSLAAYLQEQLDQSVSNVRDLPGKPSSIDLRRLRALGYTQ